MIITNDDLSTFDDFKSNLKRRRDASSEGLDNEDFDTVKSEIENIDGNLVNIVNKLAEKHKEVEPVEKYEHLISNKGLIDWAKSCNKKIKENVKDF